MILRATFYNPIEQDGKLYNHSNIGVNYEVGIQQILDENNEFDIDTMSKLTNNSFYLVDIPDYYILTAKMMSEEHKISDKDTDTYNISVPFIDKRWIIEDITLDKDIHDYVFRSSRADVFNRYCYTRYISKYIQKHIDDTYDINYVYGLLECIGSYAAINNFEKAIQQKLTHIIVVYIRDYENRDYIPDRELYDGEMDETEDNEIAYQDFRASLHSNEFFSLFSDDNDDSDDNIMRKLSSCIELSEYIRDIVSDYEKLCLTDKINRIVKEHLIKTAKEA